MTRQERPQRTSKTRKHIKLLIGARIRALEKDQMGASLLPKTLRELEEEILDDVLDRANGHLDRQSLLQLIDICIREDETYARLYQNRSLKSFYGFRARSLRVLKSFMLALHPKRWLRGPRK